MGSMTDANLAAFAEHTGIQPAKGERANTLDAMSRHAFDLIKIIELEASGIRDGDGYWHGSDPLGGTVNDIGRQMDRLRELEHSASQEQTEEWLDAAIEFPF